MKTRQAYSDCQRAYFGASAHGALIALLGGLLAACIGTAPSTAAVKPASWGDDSTSDARTGWKQVETEHFVVLSDAQDEILQDTVEWLEQTRAALLTLAWPGLKLPPVRTTVVFFASMQEMLRFVPVGYRAMVFWSALPTPLLVIAHEKKGELIQAVAHELVHDLSRWTLPIQPRWLSEGLAQYLQTTRYLRGEEKATMGIPPEQAIRSIRHSGWMGVKELFSTQRYPEDDSELQRFYAGAWLTVHYLLNNRPSQFDNYQDHLAHFELVASAWAKAFPGLTAEQLDAEIRTYVGHANFKFATARFRMPEIKTKTRQMSEAEVHGLFASLYVAGGGTREARAEINQALRTDPAELRALAQLEPKHSSTPEALALADRVIQAHPESAVAWTIAADAARIGSERRHAALQKAYQLDPWAPGVLRRLAQEQIDARNPAAALRYTRFAIRLGGITDSLLAAHLRALAASGRCDEAEAFATNGIPGMHDLNVQFLAKTWTEARASCHPKIEAPLGHPVSKGKSGAKPQ